MLNFKREKIPTEKNQKIFLTKFTYNFISKQKKNFCVKKQRSEHSKAKKKTRKTRQESFGNPKKGKKHQNSLKI